MKKLTDVLVLNKSYCALHIIGWQKAVSLIFQEAARAMDREFASYEYPDWLAFSDANVHNYPTVNTVSRCIAIPEIIVLRKYDRLPQRDVKYSRQTLFQRDNFRCAYCGETFERRALTVDHIIPRAKGGTTTWNNTTSACFDCNSKKADMTPEEAGMRLLYKPKKPSWISPLSDVKPHNMRKSWAHFTYKPLLDA